MNTFAAISLKFIIELVIALVWFILMKKYGWYNIILFFVLYLAFSIISIVIILKSLKNKTLKT